MNLRGFFVGGVSAVCFLVFAAGLDFSARFAAAEEAQTGEDQKLLDAWRKLSDEEALVAGARNTAALGFAVHSYAADHDGKLPPIAVPNPGLPFERRLSGLVLLLPYIGQRPDYVSDEDLELHRKIHGVTQDVIHQAMQLYRKIDLKKSWDAPENLEAARTVFPVFLAPKSAPLREKNGFAVSHFAFVRGFHGVDDGAYTEEAVAISDIADGTSATLGIGQIHTDLGPWIAAGTSTARYVYKPDDENAEPSFGGPFSQGWLVSFVDASPYFLDAQELTSDSLRQLTTRDSRQLSPDGYRYRPLDDEDRHRLMEYLKPN
ncbi:MAG TPA: hypothetical protein VL175_15285 [Pirellulales bacterium]|jgi:hypothetical protein|nr:hypothetical protein [Pirellulales bacterium]